MELSKLEPIQLHVPATPVADSCTSIAEKIPIPVVSMATDGLIKKACDAVVRSLSGNDSGLGSPDEVKGELTDLVPVPHNHSGSAENTGGDSSQKQDTIKRSLGACKVCGDEATGMYFGALVCVPCKTFFLRYAGDNFAFVCKKNRNCEISITSRTHCKFCRYQKCLMVGMCRKERPTQVQLNDGQQLCVVCQDLANGVHFGAITCEGCKKFFRRGLMENSSYICKNDKNCIINPRTRNACRYCRYQRCTDAGMSREAIQMGRPSKIRYPSDGNSIGPPRPKIMRQDKSPENDLTDGVQREERVSPPFSYVSTLLPPVSFTAVSPVQIKIEKPDVETSHSMTAYNTSGEQFSLMDGREKQPTICDHVSTRYSVSNTDKSPEGSYSFKSNTDNSPEQRYGSGGNVDTSPAAAQGEHTPSAPQMTETNPNLQFAPPRTNSSSSSWRYGSSPIETSVESPRQSICSPYQPDNMPASSPAAYTPVNIKTEALSPQSLQQNSTASPITPVQNNQDLYTTNAILDCFHNLQDELVPRAITSETLVDEGVQQLERLLPYDFRQDSSRQPADNAPDPDMAQAAVIDRSGLNSSLASLPHGEQSQSKREEVNKSNAWSVYQVFQILSQSLSEGSSGGESRSPSKPAEQTDVETLSSPVKPSSSRQESSSPIVIDSVDTDDSEQEVDNSEILRSCSYWTCSRFPDENIIFLESHRRIVEQILSAYKTFVEKGSEINIKLKQEFSPPSMQHMMKRCHYDTNSGENICGVNMREKLSNNDQRMADEIEERVVRLYTLSSVFYCQGLPGFSEFDLRDQYTIVRLGQSQSRILVAAVHWFDSARQEFRDFLSWRAPTYDFKKKLVSYCQQVSQVRMDSIEAALMNALILIATDYPDIKNQGVIETMRGHVMNAFRAYTTAKYGSNNRRLEELFSFVPDLRRLGVLHHKMTFSILHKP